MNDGYLYTEELKTEGMKRNWLIVIGIFLAVVLIGLIVRNKLFGKPGPGALQISTTPRAIVYIDGIQAGMTPFFDDKVKSGEHTVKLVPEATTNNLVSWEGKVNLSSGILTAVNRNFGANELSSSGEILSLEKISSKDKSALAVVSTPDQSVVKVDGEPKGFSPVLVENLTPGSHQVTVATPGYEEKTVSAKTIASYKLIINIQLAQKVEASKEASPGGEKTTTPTPQKITPTPKPKVTLGPTATPPEKPYVRIKTTPTGWLRVRAEPSTTATELAKVNPGDAFPYLNEEKNGWYKIAYEEGKEGWVKGTYVELVK